MTLIANVQEARADEDRERQERPLVDLRPMMIASTALSAFYIALRIYEQYFGTREGVLARMDFYSPFFYTYWLTVVYVAVPLELIAFVAVVAYLWRKRDRNIEAVEPREELRRMINLLGWLFVYSITIFWGFSFFGEQGGAYIQANAPDSPFTPSNIAQFYLSYPIFIIMGAGVFMYARTRVPIFASRGFSVAFVALFFGPVMLLPSVALYEWGISNWIMEELFVAPLHWTFVFFGWFSLGVFGLSLQLLGRINELRKIGEEGETLQAKPAA
ncbi:methane monooxygenase/ammonia monooxygenase subunit C [Methylocapsa palsarum]|uniref:Methane/ammonia monooxygenase subunit C n=1 Tax=Methylocapsa palsarum TaxID=1612308 RepID=A0A1I4BKS7_9HYPH|nr:methane monooxygenase/ammonia monooxygenase subunit C [Methylocapsa palsarum]SFK69143.1 methane/ammonia monooxygenase subunit C [Methylocapsa palsarum]